MTKLLTLGFFFSTAVRAVVVAKLIILDISPLTSFILALREALVAKLVTSGTFSSIVLILELYTSLLTTSFYTKLLSLIKSTITRTKLSASNLSTLFVKLLKLVGTLFSLSISNFSTLDFKLAKSTFLANFGVLTPAAFF